MTVWIVFYYWSTYEGSGKVIQSIHKSEEGALIAKEVCEFNDPYPADQDHDWGYKQFEVQD